MQHLTKEDIREVIREELSEHLSSSHHAYIESQLEEQKRKRDRWETIKTQVMGVAILGTLSFIVTQIIHFFGQHGREILEWFLKAKS